MSSNTAATSPSTGTTPTDDHYLSRELGDRLASDRALFHFMCDAATDGLWYWNLEQPDDEWMSPSFWRCFGIDPATKRHTPAEWQDIIHSEDRDLALANFERHCADPSHPYDQIVRYRHADGSTVWVRCRGLALRDDNGRPIRMLGAHTEVTDLKTTEERLETWVAELATTTNELLATRHRLHDTLASTGAAIWERNADHEPVWTSANFAAVKGFTPDEWRHFPDLDRIHPDDVEPLRAHLDLQQAMVDGREPIRPLEVDHRYRTADGSYRTVSSKVHIVERGGETVVRGLSLDVTEERRSRQALADLNQQLSEANDYLEEFSRLLSHDLRAPLRGISMLSSFIREDAEGELPPVVEEHLDELDERVESMSRLVSDMLSHAKASSLDTSDAAEVDLGRLIDGALHLTDRRDGIEVTVAGDVDAVITTSDVPLATCIRNLVGNAVKHHPGPAGHVEVSVAVAIDSVTVTVTDDGAGIHPRHHDKIFAPFKSLDNRGSGLGLASIRRIVSRVGGSIAIESEPGQGSIFTLVWPLASQ